MKAVHPTRHQRVIGFIPMARLPRVPRAWVDCAEGGQWPKDFSPECCLLWCAPLSEIDMVQHLLFYTVFGCREREQRGVVPLR